MSTKTTETTMKANGFDIRVKIEGDGVVIVIDDTQRKITADIDGVSSVSVYHKDDLFRVCTSYNIKVV